MNGEMMMPIEYLRGQINRTECSSPARRYLKQAIAGLKERDELRQRVVKLGRELDAYRDALSPDKMKALLIGAFWEHVEVPACDADDDWTMSVPVSWSTTKEILRAVKEQALLNAGYCCADCGGTTHILTIRDHGGISCCPERKLAPARTESEGE